MTEPRQWKVTVIYRDRFHEFLALATTTKGALDVALKEQPRLRRAIARGEASYEVSTHALL